ncbi:unnamed protein product [Lactuca virosa]|uniref:Kinesin-like protein n=1 Tax=Lactuca virosa TaxID=75947 RepID=A0AAU9NTU5_9ASTR|nr:unnamed protein product [Lactuca virosa]
MNAGSSRSHCIYMFTIQKEVTNEKRVRRGKVVLVDLAGSEKVEKTGAEGKVLEEANPINKSLSVRGNVISSFTSSPHAKSLHIPFRDSKLTRLLQDALTDMMDLLGSDLPVESDEGMQFTWSDGILLQRLADNRKSNQVELNELMKLCKWERNEWFMTMETSKWTREKFKKLIQKYIDVLKQPVVLILTQEAARSGIKTIAVHTSASFSDSFEKYKQVLDVSCNETQFKNRRGSYGLPLGEIKLILHWEIYVLQSVSSLTTHVSHWRKLKSP